MKNNLRAWGLSLLMPFSVGVGLLGFATASKADTATGTLSVSATVTQVCTVNNATLAFGNYSADNSTPTTATTPIQIFCTNGAAGVSVALGCGQNGDWMSGTSNCFNRNMVAANGLGGRLRYVLKSPSGQLWGGQADTVALGGSDITLDPSTSSSTPMKFGGMALNVSGEIPTGQAVPKGAYQDTVQIVVNY